MSGDDVGSIIAYLRLDRSDYSSELAAAKRAAAEGWHDPNIKIKTNAPTAIAQLAAVAVAVKRLQDAQGSETVALSRLQALQAKGISDGPKVAAAEQAVAKARRAQALATIQLANANDVNNREMAKAAAEVDSLGKSSDKTTGSFKMGLIPALLAIAPAAVPIAGVAGGALLGLIPTVATVALGVKGITDALQSGALAGTRYGADITALQGEFTTLKSIAAGGLLSGIDRGLADSHGLFATVNQDVGVMSGQIGDIVAGGAPALLRILTDLNPLFMTFGHAIADGAQHLESWAESSDGVSKFVAYVQAELPDVLKFTGELVTLLGHLAEGAAPFGGVLLHDITDFIGALDKIPVGAWAAMIPVAVSLYAAFKTYGLVTATVNGTIAAVRTMGVALGLTGPAAVAAAAEQSAASLQVEAAAAAEAVTVARSKETEAAAAAAAATEIAAAVAETGSVLAAGAAASAEAAIAFSAAMKVEADAAVLASAKVAASAEAAAEASVAAGAAAATGWAAMAGPAGLIAATVIGGGLLATMFLRSGNAAKEAAGDVDSFTSALSQSSGVINESVRSTVAHALANETLGKTLDNSALKQTTLTDLAREQGIQLSLVTGTVLGNAGAQGKLQTAIDAQSAAWQRQYAAGKISSGTLNTMQDHLINLTQGVIVQRDAFGTATQQQQDYAAEMGQSTDKTKQQTAAEKQQALAVVQLTDAYKALTGQLTRAQAATQFNQALLDTDRLLKKNNSTIADHTAKGLADQAQIESAVSALQGKDKIDAKNTTTLAKQTAAYKTDAQTLLAHIALTDHDTTAAKRASDQTYQFALRLLDLSRIKANPKISVDIREAMANVRALAIAIASLSASTSIKVGQRSTIMGNAHAAGGLISGPGTGTSDSVPAWLSTGEYVVNANAASKNRGVLDAINAQHYAAGGTVGAPSVLSAIRSATIPPPSTPQAILAALSQHVGGASTRANDAAADLAVYAKLAAQLKEVTKATNAQVAAAKHEAVQATISANKAQNYAQSLPSTTKAEKAAKAAADDHVKTLQHEATVAGNVATKVEKAAQKQQAAATKTADKAKAAYAQEAQAAKAAQQVVAANAQALVASIQSQFDTLTQSYDALKSTISGDLTGGSDLATIVGQLGTNAQTAASNLTQAEQALASVQAAVAQATPDTSALADAQSAAAVAAGQLAAAQRDVTAATASGSTARIVSAQNELTAAMTASTSAHAGLLQAQSAASSQSGPTVDQIQAVTDAQTALTAAQTAYTAAKTADSASGVASVLSGFKNSEAQFSGDLTHLKSMIGNGPAAQALITQLAGLGDTAGDALAQGLTNDPASLRAIVASMGQIQSIADGEGTQLAQGFYASGAQSMMNLIAGIEKQFPSVLAALTPLAAQLAKLFDIPMPGVPSGSGSSSSTASSGGKSVTHAADIASYYLVRDKGNGKWYDVNPTLQSVHELSAAGVARDIAAGATVNTRTSGIPHFAAGTWDAPGGPSLLGELGAELVLGPKIMNLPRHSGVIPTNVLKGAAAFGADNSAVVNKLASIDRKLDALASLPVYGPAIKQALDASTATHGMVELAMTR